MANKPSIDPANIGSLVGTFDHIFLKNIQAIDGVIPATVVAYDRNSSPPRAQVQPAINIKTTDGQSQPRAQIVNVPVCRIGSGGYFLDFNVKPGDYGLLIACDRDISLFMQNKTASAPNTYRVKSFSDSFFLPIVLKSATIDSENSEFAVLQNEDGSVCISIQTNRVKIKSDLYVDGNIQASGSITPDVPP